MRKRQAKKIRDTLWADPWGSALFYRHSTVDRANLKLGGFVVDGVVFDEMRLLHLRGHRLVDRLP